MNTPYLVDDHEPAAAGPVREAQALRTLDDLPDSTIGPRAKLLEAQADFEATEQEIRDLNAVVRRAELMLSDERAREAQFEAAARTADEIDRPQAAADFGSHQLVLRDRAESLKAAQARLAAEMPALEERRNSATEYVGALKQAIARAELVDVLELYSQRLGDANVWALGEEVLRKAFAANVFLGRSPSEYPALLCFETRLAVGPFEARRLSRGEHFVRTPEPPRARQPLRLNSVALGSRGEPDDTNSQASARGLA